MPTHFSPALLTALAAPCLAQPVAHDQPVPGVAAILAEVSAQRAHDTVTSLQSFGSRHTLSTSDSPTSGLPAALEWIQRELVACKDSLHATLESFDAPASTRLPAGAHTANVVAVIPGTKSPARAYYVVGHADSRNGDAMDATNPSPGANDDASGVAVAMECARVLAAHPCESTVVVLCTTGEEQGLIGAKFHAQALASAMHNHAPLDSTSAAGPFTSVTVLNNDIVGDPSPAFVLTPDGAPAPTNAVIRVFSEGLPRNADAETTARIRAEGAESDSTSRQLARFVSFVAAREHTTLQPMLVFRQDRFLRGGDHAAFNESGFTAVRFTVPSEDYSRQHQNVTTSDMGAPYGDLANFVDKDYLASVARLNLATLIHLANAPTAPPRARVVTSELSTSTVLRWDASPEDDTAGYEVVWRLTTDATWKHAADAGNARELRLPMSKDNFFFGVRAYDQEGYRSPVSFAWASKD